MVWSEGVEGLQQRDSPNVMASLLPPNSAHVMIPHLGAYKCSVCTYELPISCVWQIAQL